jgi:hypothetical protein
MSRGTEENHEVPHDTSFPGLHSGLGLPEYEVGADYEWMAAEDVFLHRAGLYCGNALDLCLWGAWFEILPGRRSSWQKFLVALCIPSMQVRG